MSNQNATPTPMGKSLVEDVKETLDTDPSGAPIPTIRTNAGPVQHVQLAVKPKEVEKLELPGGSKVTVNRN